MQPLIITVAAIGAELTLEQQPALPITADEIGHDAEQCAEVGASIYHLHVRDADGNPTMDVETYRAAHEAITARTDMIVQFSSGGSVTDSEAARMAPLELRPEMATLTTGTVNFGDEIFSNPLPLVARFYQRMRSLGIVPEFEIFEPGMINNAEHVYRDHRGDHHQHFDFVLGVPGAMPAWDDSVQFLSSHIPENATWSATGIGRSHLPVTLTAIEAGGHVRAGLEDVRYYEPGSLAASNSQLITRVVDLARERGREVATPAQARAILGLS
jgi:3-keto-5-aminohexanoate cleavage enzyme